MILDMETVIRPAWKEEVLKNDCREAADVFKQGSQRYSIIIIVVSKISYIDILHHKIYVMKIKHLKVFSLRYVMLRYGMLFYNILIRYSILRYVTPICYETLENDIRHALKAEVFKKDWPRSGRYCEAGLFDRYDMMQRYKVMENDTRHVLKAEVLKKYWPRSGRYCLTTRFALEVHLI